MTNFLLQTQLTADLKLADLPSHDFRVRSTLPASEVSIIFRYHTDIPGVLIVDNGKLMGVISRRKFFEQLGQLYGPSIYLKRPIGVMLETLNSHCLQLPASTRIYEATSRVFSRPEIWVYEPIVVELDNQTYRLLDVRILLIAQTRLLASLQKELEQVNDELEERVALRTTQLTQINHNLEEQIARRKQVEEALILARDEALQASRLKTELLAKVGHELRTPIGAILGYIEMLQLGFYGPISEEQREVAARVFKSGQDLNNMVNELLDEAQLAAGKFRLNITTFNPREIVENTLTRMSILAQKKGLALTADIAADIPPLLSGDHVRLQQILVNLVGNAIKFTQHGSVQIRLYRPGPGRWVIRVADTGCGIPSQEQARIFEPFRQVDGSASREHGGTGLGLSIVKQLTDLMQGQINLTSAVGQGSTFTVTLPLITIPEKVYA